MICPGCGNRGREVSLSEGVGKDAGRIVDIYHKLTIRNRKGSADAQQCGSGFPGGAKKGAMT